MCKGYLLKDIPPNELVQAVRAAYLGKVQLHPDIARTLMTAVATQQAHPAAPPSAARLRPRMTSRSAS